MQIKFSSVQFSSVRVNAYKCAKFQAHKQFSTYCLNNILLSQWNIIVVYRIWLTMLHIINGKPYNVQFRGRWRQPFRQRLQTDSARTPVDPPRRRTCGSGWWQTRRRAGAGTWTLMLLYPSARTCMAATQPSRSIEGLLFTSNMVLKIEGFWLFFYSCNTISKPYILVHQC